MEAARGENGGFASRASISISSSSTAQVQFPHSRGGHMHMPSDPSQMARPKVKFMCSSAGKILPRPSDLKLRYVGGETRMISVPRYINFTDFLAKMVEIYGPDIVLKYQLPEEDLDALVTVSTDEDLENMLEECDRLNSVGGSSKIRVFVFHASELDNSLQDLTDIQNSGQKFVDAINAADTPCTNCHSYKPAFTNSNINTLRDGYETWNNVQTQDRGPDVAENFQSKVHPLENHVTAENPMNHVSDGQSQENISQKSTFMDHASSTLDNTNDTDFYDLERDASGGSFLLTAHGMKQNYLENPWASSSPTQAHKEKGLVLQCGNEDEVTSNDKAEINTGHGYIDIQNQFERFEPYKEYIDSGMQLHGNLFPLSPGTLLQKQLQSNQHKAEIQRDDLLFMDDIQHYPKVHGFNQQPIHEHQEMKGHQYQWDNLPAYDSSGPLDNKYMDSNIANPQASQRGRYTGTPPLSSPRNELTGETTDDFLQHTDPYYASSAATSHLISGNVPEASSNAPEMNKGKSEYKSYVMDFSLQERVEDGNGHLNIYPTLKTDNTAQEETQDQLNYQGWTVQRGPTSDICTLRSDENYLLQGKDDQEIGWSTQDSESFSDRFSNIVSTNAANKEAFLAHNNSETKFLPFLERLQSQALPYAEQDPQGNGNEALMPEMKSPSFIDNFPTLDMITDLLQTSQLVDCLPADSSSAQSIGSRSAYSLEDEFSAHKGDAFMTKHDIRELTTNRDLPATQRHVQDQNWNIHDALPSKEEFDTSVFTSVFNRDFQDNNRMRAPDTRNITDAPETHSVKAPALSSLIDSWEASLIQDGHKYHAEMQYGKHQHQMIDLVPNANTDVIHEDSRFEFEEVEEFKSFDSVPIDPVAAAEREAQNRGLQIIRNADLEELRELGSGTFGTVYHGKWRGTDVAIKRIKASCFAGRDAERNRLMDDFWREACILGKLHHPNVVAFYGVVPDGPGGTLATVTEYMVNGSLKQVLQNKDRTLLDRRKRLLIAMDAAFGMEYLHAKNVVHFDIKCENLLVNMRDPQRPICKVGDLGLSKIKQQTFVSGGVRGTLPWMAPELLSGGTGLVSEKVDVFSFGIVLWELLTGEEPYANMHYGAIIGGIVSNTLRPTVPRWCDPEWKALMERCWAADPSERPTFYEIAGTLRAMEASLNAKTQGTAGPY